MATQQLCFALLLLSVMSHMFPSTLGIGLRVTCPNHDCYDDARELRLQAAALRQLVQLMQNKKIERTTDDERPVTQGGLGASSLCFCSPVAKVLMCPWNAAHPSQGLSCAN